MALELSRAEGLGLCVAEKINEQFTWKLTDLGLEYCQATIGKCEEMARKSKVKVEVEEVQEDEIDESYQDKFDAAVLKAIRLGATSYATVRNDVVKAQRILPQGPQEDWPCEFDKSLLRLIRSGQVAVINGKYWVRTGDAPRWEKL
jgi:hypothetical protein